MIRIEDHCDERSSVNDRSDISNTVSNISMRRHKDMLCDMSFSFISNNEFLIGAEPAFVYEQIIQKLESDIRNHIKVENQLKLILETAQFKMEEYEKEVKDEKDKIEENLKKKEVQVLELEEKIKKLQSKPKPLMISLAPNQTGHTGSIISSYSGKINDNTFRSKSKLNEITPVSKFEPCTARRTSLPENNQRQMFLVRERRRSASTHQSHQNSASKQGEASTYFENQDPSCVPKYLSLISSEREGIQRNSSNMNKPRFQFTDNSEKNIISNNDIIYHSNILNSSRSNQAELKNEISRKLIKQFLINRKNDGEFQTKIGDSNADENYPKNMIKYLNINNDNQSTNTPATCLKFSETIKQKSRPGSKKKPKGIKLSQNVQTSSTIQSTTKIPKHKIYQRNQGSNERQALTSREDPASQIEILRKAQELLFKSSVHASPINHKAAASKVKKSPKLISKLGKSRIKKSNSALSKSSRKSSREKRRKATSPPNY